MSDALQNKSQPTEISPLADFFAERRACMEALEAAAVAKEQAEKAEARAKAEAKKAAILADPTHPKNVQAKHAQECKRAKEEDKRHREMILQRAKGDREE